MPASSQAEPVDSQGFRILSVPVVSWALYDFANTIFSLSIGTRYFNEWIVQDKNNPDWYLAAMTVAMTVLLLFTMPALGAVADRMGRRKPFVIGFTLLSIACTTMLGFVDSTITALILAGLAIFGFQSALAHYDPMLGDVAPESHHGRVSGIGVSVGYMGSFFALVTLAYIVGSGDKQDAFIPTAIMYLAFSLPLFLFVHDHGKRRVPSNEIGTIVRAANRQLVATVRRLPEYKDVLRLLVARFLYVDALAVIIAYMTIYLDRLGGFDASAKNLVLAVSIAAAIVGAFVAGWLVEHLGPKRVLLSVLAAVVFAFLAEAATASSALIWVLGPVVGIGLGAIWASDRVFMMRITPPAERGEFFGIYHLVGKVSNGSGVVIWGATVWFVHEQQGLSELAGSRWALAVLAATTIIGMLIIRPVSDEPRDFPNDPLEDDTAAAAGV